MMSWTDAAAEQASNQLPTSFQPAGATSQNWMKMYKNPLRIVGKDNFPYTNPMKKRALTLDSEQDEDVPRPGR